jgi:hypothetical protein
MTRLLSWLKSLESQLQEFLRSGKMNFQVWAGPDNSNWGEGSIPTRNLDPCGWHGEPTLFAEMTVAPGSVVLRLLPPFYVTLDETSSSPERWPVEAGPEKSMPSQT